MQTDPYPLSAWQLPSCMLRTICPSFFFSGLYTDYSESPWGEDQCKLPLSSWILRQIGWHRTSWKALKMSCEYGGTVLGIVSTYHTESLCLDSCLKALACINSHTRGFRPKSRLLTMYGTGQKVLFFRLTADLGLIILYVLQTWESKTHRFRLREAEAIIIAHPHFQLNPVAHPSSLSLLDIFKITIHVWAGQQDPVK